MFLTQRRKDAEMQREEVFFLCAFAVLSPDFLFFREDFPEFSSQASLFQPVRLGVLCALGALCVIPKAVQIWLRLRRAKSLR